MSWVRLDDGFFRHPKVVTAGRDARDLYLAALCYSGAGLTDGRVPAAALRVLGAEADIDDPKAAAERLIACGLWDHDGDTFVIHDYHEYNPTKERVLATREARAEAGSKGGKQKSSNLLDAGLAKDKQKSSGDEAKTYHVNDTSTSTSTENEENEEAKASADESAGEEPAEPEDSPESRKKAEGHVYALVDAFAFVTKRAPSQIQGRDRKDAAAAFRPIARQTTTDDLAGCASYLRSDPFWRESGRLTARKLAQTIPEWIVDGRPPAIAPKSGSSLNGRRPKSSAVKDMLAEEEAKRDIGRAPPEPTDVIDPAYTVKE